MTSDLHGASLGELFALLEKARFSDCDFLFILGDVIDRRGDGGVEILRWLLTQPNVEFLLGNHEEVLLACDFVFSEVTDEAIDSFSAEKLEMLMTYSREGGDVTLKSMRELLHTSPQTACDILDFLREAPLLETVHAGGRDFILTHAGLGNFSPDKPLGDYTREELLWMRPGAHTRYFDDAITVFGHTPTLAFGQAHRGRIFRTETFIDVDAGAAYGFSPALLRLDDLREFYL